MIEFRRTSITFATVDVVVVRKQILSKNNKIMNTILLLFDKYYAKIELNTINVGIRSFKKHANHLDSR